MKYYITAYLLFAVCFAQAHMEKIIGQEECKICHKKEYGVWAGTLHNQTYDSLHVSSTTAKIMKRLKLSGSPKKQESCRRCHYTAKPRGSFIRTIGAIACERCHGAAKDWVMIHNIADIDKTERRKKAGEAGMFHPGDVYGIANNCYSCHIIDDEKLVDRGRHPIGKEDFKFVVETQGKMRHNFTSGKGINIPASPQRKRLFYIVGQSLELQHYLRALGNSKKQRNFFLLTRARLKKCADEMVNIHKATNKKETEFILKVLSEVKVTPNNKAQLYKAADYIHNATRKLIDNYEIESISSLDALLPKE
ncbi:multiheme c-type cytochrome [Candidatus Uabimicrobium amorphum]|uniref:Cytochrome c554 n=1 Tax=Uabimicrobium amorphum TaxID=2596890 RepID=A0A5S9F198_UABAM|nr:multiheme c-type cytochrome [Candidatus Uabimicrobium amorphum]BBM81873.1 cytochrome c554 [Candidatus Uabimicrobium amorphum]